MRITNGMLRDAALRSLSTNVAALARIQEEVSTTRRLNRPSDDPAQVREAVRVRDGLAELEQFLRNIDSAARSMAAAEAAIGTAGEAIQRARELAIQGANDTISASDRFHIAEEVAQLAGQLVQLAATKVGDSYVFSGFRTDLAPYASPTGAYQGDSGVVLARIAPDTTIEVNVLADAVFGPALAALAALQNELGAGSRVSAGNITSLDAGQTALLAGRSKLGARQVRLEETSVYLGDAVIAGTRLLSEIEDADMTAAITELSERQMTYEAALKVNALILRNSLIDELR